MLRVEDTFLVEGRGLIVAPSPLLSEYSGTTKLDVTLVKPDRTELTACLSFYRVHVNTSPPLPPDKYRWGCMFHHLSKDDVPIGTEIWYDESA